ncbi:MAG: HAD hydrolase-like protein [Nitrospira sp.]|nr:HAD hydrolase-like protein [Nitrospira sp.]
MYVCPHHPDDGCDCRKPNRGLIDRAVGEQRIDLSRSYLIGDHPRDIDLAKRVGSRSILVTTGATLPEQVEGLNASGTVPDRVASSIAEAVDWLLIDARSRMSLEGDSRGHLRS